MHALHELGALAFMALTTRTGNVDFGDWRLRIGGGKDVVTFMTISTNGGRGISLRKRLCVHTLAIREEWPVTDAAPLKD